MKNISRNGKPEAVEIWQTGNWGLCFTGRKMLHKCLLCISQTHWTNRATTECTSLRACWSCWGVHTLPWVPTVLWNFYAFTMMFYLLYKVDVCWCHAMTWWCLLAMHYIPHELPFCDVFETKTNQCQANNWLRAQLNGTSLLDYAFLLPWMAQFQLPLPRPGFFYILSKSGW